MIITIDGESFELNVKAIQSDLKDDGMELVTISAHGELVVDDMNHGPDYEYRREVWQFTDPPACYTSIWANAHWEFCRSVKLSPDPL